jgi:hypothetical protein
MTLTESPATSGNGRAGSGFRTDRTALRAPASTHTSHLRAYTLRIRPYVVHLARGWGTSDFMDDAPPWDGGFAYALCIWYVRARRDSNMRGAALARSPLAPQPWHVTVTNLAIRARKP